MSAAKRLSVLFVTSEVAPLIKTGGLADVAGSLPAALMQAGADVRVLVPGYKQVMEGVKSKGRLASFPALGEMPASQLLAGKLPSGVPLLIVDSAPLYDRPGGPYQDTSGNDWPDNAVRFGAATPSTFTLPCLIIASEPVGVSIYIETSPPTSAVAAGAPPL